MPFLEVVTRCYKRPQMLRHNRASIEALGNDVRQAFLVDEVGIGIGGAYERFAQHEPLGRWVWVLDDDDLCIYPNLIGDLKAIDAHHAPDVVMVKMDHGSAILPDKFHWRQPPAKGYIGVSAYIVRREVWMEHRHAFAPGCYESDFNFIAAVFAADPEIYWHDIVASKVQRVSKGEPE